MTQIPLSTQGTIEGILRAIKDIKQVLLGRVTFGDNIACKVVTDTYAGAPNTDIVIDHNLGRIPTGFVAFGVGMSATLYQGTAPWTKTQIVLSSSTTPVTFQVIIF